MESSIVYPEGVPYEKCLDRGFVALVDFMGSDSRVVAAARVSYQEGTKAVQDDRHLIRYLIRNKHTTPLEKVVFEFHVKAPIFIARQWFRHRTGSFNEVSARYSIMKDEFYVPDPMRKQSSSNRQGSSDETLIEFKPTPTANLIKTAEYLRVLNDSAYEDYESLVAAGAARELARAVLPVSLYTEFYWTVNLWNLMHFLNLRLDKHAQYEIRVFGEAILSLLKQIPELAFCIEAFEDYIVGAPGLSKFEVEVIQDLIDELTPKGALPSENQQKVRDLLTKLVEEHPSMSKREKKESRLIELLCGVQDEA